MFNKIILYIGKQFLEEQSGESSQIINIYIKKHEKEDSCSPKKENKRSKKVKLLGQPNTQL